MIDIFIFFLKKKRSKTKTIINEYFEKKIKFFNLPTRIDRFSSIFFILIWFPKCINWMEQLDKTILSIRIMKIKPLRWVITMSRFVSKQLLMCD